MIGSKIGSYEIIEELGTGSSTTSFLARDDRGKLAVAKRLLDRLCADEATRKKFLAVSELSAKIRMRKNLAVVSGRKSSSEGTFLLREYVEGRPLTEALGNGTLDDPESEAVRQIVLGLCDAVRAMATRKVIHGGIHPGNVIVRTDGQIKLTDFGSSLAVLSGSIESSYPLEALRYLPAEQLQGEPCTSSADIYAAGLIIAALLKNHGKEVFDLKDRPSLEAQIRKGFAVECPVLAAAVHPNPSRRYPDVDKFRKGLVEKYFRPPEPDPPKPKPKPPKPDPPEPKPAPPEPPAPKPEPDPPEPAPPQPGPAPEPTGVLKSIFDVKAGSPLSLKSPSALCKVPQDGRRQQRPFQLSNGGPGRLEVAVSCVGKGVSASPDQIDISPGRALGVIINLEPVSDQFTDVVLKWAEQNQEKTFTIKLYRTS